MKRLLTEAALAQMPIAGMLTTLSMLAILGCSKHSGELAVIEFETAQARCHHRSSVESIATRSELGNQITRVTNVE